MRLIQNYINGKYRESSSGEWIDIFAPGTGKVLGKLVNSNQSDVEHAVESAVAAAKDWATLGALKRSEILENVAQTIENELEDWAQLESLDTGKPISLCRSLDIPRAISNFRFFSQLVKEEISKNSNFTDSHLKLTFSKASEYWGEFYQKENQLSFVCRQPVGVVGLITPWNLPIYLLTWKLAPALIMGNTVVAKPSELTPLTANKLGDVLKRAGLPDGVFNVINGYGHQAGQSIVEHESIKAISFTGGTKTGAMVATTAAKQFKKLSLELGGKNPTLVFEDAHLKKTASGVIRSSFLNQGQICLCGSRIFVQEQIYDQFKLELLEELKKWPVGSAASPETKIAALISKGHLEKIEYYVTLAKELGGKILTGGKPPVARPELGDGYYWEPTIIEGLPNNSRVAQEEIFGPVITLHKFTEEAEAVQLANDVKYGLAASVWCRDQVRAFRVASQLQAGTVWINSWLARDLRVPFGGMKQSGLGREGGKLSLDFFSEIQTISIDNSFYPKE